MATLLFLLITDNRHLEWVAGKLQRLEEERQAHVSQLEAQDATLEDMDRQGHELQAQADTALQNLKEVGHCNTRCRRLLCLGCP